ncbi:carbon-nitrogen hydrolase family protein [Nocardioides sp. ChNu-99]|uniref:carbon-nitrogen hydrolase family protein n=1 Tax=Nocardioides sp. ChNu-99 TaxID=2839897 RepID=UPI00240734DE|nr:carbon-nitrogen hydrolase family protein [Nocardioides sp. ChNu-99]MDF9714903.1 carbon-nitrogen hydrolase family protein [Nocardioides sp. ChNu-99]
MSSPGSGAAPPAVLRVALVQEASGLDPAANRRRLAEVVAHAGPGADLVVLPEAFARDFGTAGSDVSAFDEPLDGPFVTAAVAAAARAGTTVLAGMFETSDDPARPWNTLVLVDAGGVRASYRKIHLYDSFGYRESDRLSAGEPTPVVAAVAGFTVGLLTCYDLRFPELARALVVDHGAEVLVCPAAWLAGEGKAHHWRTLAAARAIEDTAYVVATGQPAPRYTGRSVVVDPLGRTLAEAGDGPEVLHAELRRDVLDEARRTNPSLANRRL